MTAVRVIPLEGTVPENESGSLEFLSIAVSATATGLGVVQYKDEGKKQPLGLRIDLDKGVFLDHLDDESKEETLVNSVQYIRSAVFAAVSNT